MNCFANDISMFKTYNKHNKEARIISWRTCKGVLCLVRLLFNNQAKRFIKKTRRMIV
jgi:hypothetical protein